MRTDSKPISKNAQLSLPYPFFSTGAASFEKEVRLLVGSLRCCLAGYLEGLKEASTATTAAVLQLVVISPDAHHGLAVHVELLVKRFQQG